jgi:hypothetical protein
MRVMFLLMRARETGGATSRQVRAVLRNAYSEAEALLDELRGAQWIGRMETPQGETRWVLICDPDTVRVADVFRRFAFDARRARLRLEIEDPALAQGIGQVAGWVEAGLGETLAQAFRADNAVQRGARKGREAGAISEAQASAQPGKAAPPNQAELTEGG